MGAAPVVLQSTTQQATALIANLFGLTILAGTIAVIVAFLYRWYVRETVPWGLAALLGLAGVAALLNTTSILGQVIGGTSDVTEIQEALFNIAAFVVGFAGAMVGRRVGDRFAADVFGATSFASVDEGVSSLVKAVGRVITVELPDEIEDVVGYDPVPEATKETLAGRRFLFPRGLTVDELESRLRSRLRTDYAVGHVDLELEDDGTVTHLGLGSRAAGIGPTLPPSTNAMAVRADPAFAASAGDLVQVWTTDPLQRVLTAELRGVADDVVTLAIDAADTPKLDPDTQYRLVTLPVEDRPEREFASLLRTADETYAATTVQAGSPLDGLAVGALDVTVIAVTSPGESPDALPPATRVVRAGDVINAIARPEALRRLETAAAAGTDPSVAGETPAVGLPDSSSNPGVSAAGTSATEVASDDPPGQDVTAEGGPAEDVFTEDAPADHDDSSAGDEAGEPKAETNDGEGEAASDDSSSADPDDATDSTDDESGPPGRPDE